VSPLVPLFLVVFVGMTGFGLVIPIAPFFGLHLGASATEITIALGAYSVGQLIAAPIWGRMSDRYGRRPILIATLAITAALYVALAFATSIEAVGWTRFTAGLAAGNIAAAFAAATDISTPETRARTMGVIGAGFGLGFIVGPAIGGLLAGADPDQADFARVCFVSAALAFVAALSALLFLPETRRADAKHSHKRIALLQRPVLLALVSAGFLLTFAQSLMESAFALWAAARLGWDPPQMGLSFAVIGLIAAGLQGGGAGALAKRYRPAQLLGAGFSAFALGLGILALAADAVQTYAGMVLLAIGSGLVNPPLLTLISGQAAEDERGAVLGVQQSSGALARVFGPLSAGPLFDLLAPNAPFIMAMLAALAGLAVGLLACRPRLVVER
jgi:DHA1 family tetracycline resistance protein-like MFS transporter